MPIKSAKKQIKYENSVENISQSTQKANTEYREKERKIKMNEEMLRNQANPYEKRILSQNSRAVIKSLEQDCHSLKYKLKRLMCS